MKAALRLAAAVVLASGGPLALAPTAGAQVDRPTVEIVNFEYRPGVLELALGTEVTWKNSGDRPHTITDRGGTFDSGPVQPGATLAITFTTPGAYHVFCRVHLTQMNGILSVFAGTTATSSVRIEAVDPALEGEVLRYEPPVITVRTGTAVVFANAGGQPHSLTSDDALFDTGILAPGAEGGRFAGANATFTLPAPGTFTFHCQIHLSMQGTITVVGEPLATPGPSPPSPAPTRVTVDVAEYAFGDAQVSVAPGGQVTFRNRGRVAHTATLDDEPGDTGAIAPGATGTLVAPVRPGSYSYRCTVHPARMRGVLVVVGEHTGDPTVEGAMLGGRPTVGSGGPGRGLSALVLATAVFGAFLGGIGMARFARPKPGWSRGRTG